ncbi:MAG: hypothetical protein GY863_11435 [bacterium]|nr:hypothetical protein [bacterium]
MKLFKLINCLLFIAYIFVNSSYSQERESEFPLLTGPYLGQKPPGITAEVFAPGIISLKTRSEFASNFSPDGKEFYVTMWERQDREDERIWYMINKDGSWTKPKLAQFSYDCFEYRAFYPSGNNRIYYLSKRPLKDQGENSDYANIWFVTRDDNKWNDPEMVIFQDEPVQPRYFTVSRDGTIYFNGNLRRGIYKSELIRGKYQQPQPVSKAVQSINGASHPFIAPDKSYIIVDAPVKSKYPGDYDLFISFKNNEGTWTELIHMGEEVNSGYFEGCATVSNDGKYIFFSRFVDGQSDIYWIDAKIIETLKPADIR